MPSQITPVGELLTRTWIEYKQRALPIIAVILISTVLVSTLVLAMVLFGAFGGAFLFFHLMQNTTGIAIIMAVITLFTLVITIALIWCQTAMLAIVVDAELGIIEAFQRGWQYLWPMTWVLTFFTGILLTGFTLGILPGFLFLVWFSFCGFILLEEDRRGLDSLLASREYVRGYGWNTFGKLAVIWLISLVATVIPFIGQVLSILLTPFLLLYILGMYHDLKAIREPVELEDTTASKIFWWIITIIGLLLPIAALLGLAYVFLTGEQQWTMPEWQAPHGIPL